MAKLTPLSLISLLALAACYAEIGPDDTETESFAINPAPGPGAGEDNPDDCGKGHPQGDYDVHGYTNSGGDACHSFGLPPGGTVDDCRSDSIACGDGNWLFGGVACSSSSGAGCQSWCEEKVGSSFTKKALSNCDEAHSYNWNNKKFVTCLRDGNNHVKICTCQ